MPKERDIVDAMSVSFPPESPLHAFTTAEVGAIFAAGTLRRFRVGEAIVTEGAPGESMFFLVEGTAEARLEAGLRVRNYVPGSYFGELSFINPGHRRSITIVATSDAALHELDQKSIQSLMTTHASAIFTLLRRACAFLVDAERALIADLRKQNAALQETVKKLDFTQRRLSQEEETARTDALTGLYNRRGFDAEAPNFLERARAVGLGLALIAMDLDHFKPVNDQLGHAAGDEVLRQVGKILQASVRKSDLPCRTGGDEFIIVLADLDEAAARARAEQICATIGKMDHPGTDRGIRCTATLGGTLFRPGETLAELMHRADEALYGVKRAGRNRVGWD